MAKIENTTPNAGEDMNNRNLAFIDDRDAKWFS